MATIYLSSTYADLKTHREAAYRALRRLGHDVIAMEDSVARDDRPLDACLADVARCDVYVGIIGWRYGHVPNQDNRGRRSITELEYRKAVELQKPRFLFLVAEDAPWPPMFVDRGEPAVALKALRDELAEGRLVSFFKTEPELGELVSAALSNWERGVPPVAPPGAQDRLPERLREYREPGLPDRPYPLLQPYTHPAVFGGRDRERDELDRLVNAPQLVLCLHAPSGAGKSSLLRAGLVPRLRARGHPVSLEWHPRRAGSPAPNRVGPARGAV